VSALAPQGIIAERTAMTKSSKHSRLNRSSSPSLTVRIFPLLLGRFLLTDQCTVDTSTGVLSPAKHIASLVKQYSPDTLIALDAVCSVASEEIRFDDWGIDVVISATQKGIGAPPGLSVLMASGRAIQVCGVKSSKMS
jgi:hypothetical protein